MFETTIRAKVLFFGLQEGVAQLLQLALAKLGGEAEMEAVSANDCLELAWRRGADVLFCGPDTSTIRELRRQFPQTVIIAASRIPSTDDWLNTIEAGADDYCAAPFEIEQLRWILESNLGTVRAAA